jgi:Trypsin
MTRSIPGGLKAALSWGALVCWPWTSVSCAAPPPQDRAHTFVLQPANPVFHGEVFGDGSRDADPQDWRATFVLSRPSGSECTATAVGDRVILTAAHCMTDATRGNLRVGPRPYPIVECESHAAYQLGDPQADFALCLVTPAMRPSPAGFEVINKKTASPPRDANITLVGFGCRMEGGTDRGFGRLAEGEAIVLSKDDHSLQTGGHATLCLGDSGGGAYWAADQGHLQRRLVAVNSASDLHEISTLSLTSSALFLGWATSWANSHKQKICGLDPNATHCHQ